ncbi:hypothetical protein [Marivita geojedonensis]|nr:hypothetical protein [Marivita geojedonensis]
MTQRVCSKSKRCDLKVVGGKAPMERATGVDPGFAEELPGR